MHRATFACLAASLTLVAAANAQTPQPGVPPTATPPISPPPSQAEPHPKAAAPNAPPEVDAPALFAQKCAGCHGADGSGKKHHRGLPNFRSPRWAAHQKPGEIEEAIRDGVPHTKMPAFGKKLDRLQIDALATYLRGLSSGEGTPRPAP